MPIYQGSTEITPKHILLGSNNISHVYVGDTLVWQKNYAETAKYGFLYNYFAVSDARDIAPAGWHVPTLSEYLDMFGFIVTSLDGGKIKGLRVKPDEHPRWNSPNVGATNEFDWDGYGGGYREDDGTFDFNGFKGFWWTADGYYFCIKNDSAQYFFGNDFDYRYGLSVRLVKDDGDLGDGVMTDNDGNIYDTVKIGDQVWMKENLRVVNFRGSYEYVAYVDRVESDGGVIADDGQLVDFFEYLTGSYVTEIPKVQDDEEWSVLETPAYCIYDYNQKQKELFHNKLKGLQGGKEADEFFHLTKQEYENLCSLPIGGVEDDIPIKLSDEPCDWGLINKAELIGNQGNQGDQGFQGHQGNQGFQGNQGNIGNQGFQGHQGSQGNIGIQGNQGERGFQGFQGFQGNQGNQGNIGNQGNQGFQGNIGNQGERGFQGFQGNQGDQGNQGFQGVGTQGFQGDAGTGLNNRGYWLYGESYGVGDYVFDDSSTDPSVNSMWICYVDIPNSILQPKDDLNHWIEFQAPRGEQGNQGFQGNQGNQGNIGNQGNQGHQGNQGFQGNNGSQGFQGNQGNNGLQGNQGFQGNQGNQGNIGNQGLQGHQGSQGNIGVQGNQGFQGNQGNQGNIGNQGEQGVQGHQGNNGLQGNQGNQGNQGLRGFQGFQGFQGNVGVQGNQGERGFQGFQGFQGNQGDKGSIGNQGSQGNQGNQGFQGNMGIGSGTLLYKIFSTTNNPSSGYVNANSSIFNNITQIKVSVDSLSSNSILSFLLEFGANDYLQINKVGALNTGGYYYINSVFNFGSHVTINLTNLGSTINASYTNDDNVFVAFSKRGFTGSQGNQGIQGNQGDRIILRASEEFIEYAYESTPTSWNHIIDIEDLRGNQGFQGGQGSQGNQGAQGAQGATGDSYWEIISSRLYPKSPFVIGVGSNNSDIETAIIPRQSNCKNIGTNNVRFNDFHINKNIVYGEEIFAGSNSPFPIRWIRKVNVNGTDLDYINANGELKIKMLQNGDMVFFVNENEESEES